MKVKFRFIFIWMTVIVLSSGCTSLYNGNHKLEVLDAHTIVDNQGTKVTVDKPYTKIVSLYSAHTENLYAIGAGEQLMGASPTSIYPPEAAFVTKFDYREDPEPLIHANPDLVIVRPFIERSYPDYIKGLEKAGIQVISLYPDDEGSFATYIEILGILTGHRDEALAQLDGLKARLDAIEAVTSEIPESDRQKVYFESTKTAYRTVIEASNPGRAIEIAGGINIASGVEAMTKGSTIAEFGIERLMINADDIDVYISQRGAMNAGGSIISIPQREGFKAIKAVREGRILELNEKIISSPTFRYDKGVLEIARMLYPEVMDVIELDPSGQPIQRGDYAEILVKTQHLPIFIPSSSHYYEKDHLVHNFGLYKDVDPKNSQFDMIETAALNSLIRGYRDSENAEYFDPEGAVSRADLAYSLYILGDQVDGSVAVSIKDIENHKDSKIIQKVVNKGWMTLDASGNFRPNETVTQAYVLTTLKVLVNE